jgi:hypothetical protein
MPQKRTIHQIYQEFPLSSLTADEILALHESDTEPTGMVAKFKFDENTGTTVTDTVNGYTGAVANGAWSTQVWTKARTAR